MKTKIEALKKRANYLNRSLTDLEIAMVCAAINSQSSCYPRVYDLAELRFTFYANGRVSLGFNYGKLNK